MIYGNKGFGYVTIDYINLVAIVQGVTHVLRKTVVTVERPGTKKYLEYR